MADIIDIRTRATINRRAETRRRAYKGAILRFNNGFSAFEAIVRNQSDSGAMLAFGDTIGVPQLFELSIFGEAARRIAQVRWRSMTTVGVVFVQGAGDAPLPSQP